MDIDIINARDTKFTEAVSLSFHGVEEASFDLFHKVLYVLVTIQQKRSGGVGYCVYTAYSPAAYEARLISPRVFWLDCKLLTCPQLVCLFFPSSPL